MKTIFDNPEYLAKQLLSLISDEGKRIVSMNLATGSDIKRIVEPVIKLAIGNSASNPNVLINTLGLVHNILSDVKLPNDFTGASNDVDKIVLIFNPDGNELASNIMEDNKEDVDGEKKDKEEDVEEEAEEDQDCSEFNNNAREAVKKLEKLARDFGMQGEHERAYIIEKALREIDKLIE